MEQYGNMLAGAGIVVYITIAIFIALTGWGTYRLYKQKKIKSIKGKLPSDATYEEVSSQTPQEDDKDKEYKGGVTLGSGEYQCLCFRDIQGMPVADFTRINKPIGELYQFDTSCPLSGNGYIVKKDKGGHIVDYDPRQEKYKEKDTPEYAWLCINGDEITKKFWSVDIKWWKSSSIIFAVLMLAVTFISGLVVFD